MLKRVAWSTFLLILTLMPVYALPSGGVVTLDKTNLEKQELVTGKENISISGSLLLNTSEDLAKLIDVQKEHDVKDLELLWKGTVENNQVIEFALK